MTILFLILQISFSALTHAGASDRGGGNAMVCFSDPEIPKRIRDKSSSDYGKISSQSLQNITSIEVLDLVQAKLSRFPGHESDVVYWNENEGETHHAYLEKLMKRLTNYTPGIYAKIDNGLRSLRNNTRYSSHGVALIEDANILFDLDRDHCVIATMAAQDANFDALYIDNRLFNHPKHTEQSKAVLFLHEGIYYHLLRKGIFDSSGVRAIIAKILSTSHPNSVMDFIETAKRAGFANTKEEMMNGIEFQYQRALDSLKDGWEFDTHVFWFIGLPDEYRSSRKVAWNAYKGYWDDLRKFEWYLSFCIDFASCEVAFLKVIEENPDPNVKKEAERLLGRTIGYKKAFLSMGRKLRERFDVKTRDYFSVKTDPFGNDGFPLPIEEIDWNRENFLNEIERMAQNADQEILSVVRLPQASFEEYEAKVMPYAEEVYARSERLILQYMRLSGTTTNLQLPRWPF